MVEDGRMAALPKKEQSVLGKELAKLQANLDGIRDMKALPKALFVVDTRREEIAIMRMVGASNGFIRCPFIVEGLVLGILGGLLAFVIEWGLYSLLISKVMGGVASTLITLVPFAAVMWPLLIAFLGVGILVGVFGGSSAIRNYLKV